MTALKANRGDGSIVRLDTIYIDSTFFHKSYRHFPDQHESAAAIGDLIEAWLRRSADHVISLRTCARYGYEFLFKAIAERFGQPIHVNVSELEKYQHFPELDGCFTATAAVSTTHSRIHACFSPSVKNSMVQLCCDPAYETKFVRVIRPTAMAWTNWQRWQAIDDGGGDGGGNGQFIRACYSNHASYTEVKDLLLHLKPGRVELNVVPGTSTARKQMMDDLDEVMKECGGGDVVRSAEFVPPPRLKFDRIEFNDYDDDDERAQDTAPIVLLKRRKLK